MNDLSKQQISRLATVILVLGLMIARVVNAQTTPFITFEGYESGVGAPPGPVGGVIASQGTRPEDPWFDDHYPYRYLDGWNYAPRVSEGQYQGLWAEGGHAGTGTEAQGWNSLNNSDPGRYVIDFQGYEFDHNFCYWEGEGYSPGDPRYGHEDRWYKRIVGGTEGTWQILDTDDDVSIACGTLGNCLYMDIFNDLDNLDTTDWHPYMEATGTLIAMDDGGAFYNELMSQYGSSVMDFTVLCEEPPAQTQNPGAPLDEAWAIYGIKWTITPAGPIKVDADAPGPIHNGTSWDNAYKYLQDALAAASGGDKIWVAQGTYKPDQGAGQTLSDRKAAFQLTNGVHTYGGFAGYGAADPDARDIKLYETILSGDIGVLGDDSDNCYHVVGAQWVGDVLDGFTITGGNANGPDHYSDDMGGGIYHGAEGGTVVNCTITGNSAKWGGGMAHVEANSTGIINCSFIGNSATNEGGGMYNVVGSHAIIIGCTFTRNSAPGGGGAVFNVVVDAGGYADGSHSDITNCILWGNSGGEITGDAIVNYSDIQGGWAGTGTSNIDDDPLFADADGRLSAGSPCIDAGDNTAVPPDTADLDGDSDTTEPTPFDLDGNPRIINNIVDIGAYEYQGDQDDDGIADPEEMGPDGTDSSYDGNQDGTQDKQQSNVASLHTYDRQYYVTLATPDGTTMTNIRAVDNPSPADAPSGVDFPIGFFEFTIQGIPAGGSVTVTLFLPPGVTIGTYYKFGPTPTDPSDHWYEFLFDGTTGAEILTDKAILHFADGQRGDNDLTADGKVVEPGAPGLLLPSGLVSWWPGNGRADDIVGGNHGTLMNGVTYAHGKVGPAFSFDGVDDYVEIPYDDSFNLSSFTLQAWVKFTQSNALACIISRPSGGNPIDGYSFFRLDNVWGRIGGGVQGEGQYYSSSVSTGSAAFADGNWHMCSFVRDVQVDKLRIYVDAVLYGSSANSSPGDMEHNYKGIIIGSCDGSRDFFDGLIDEVKIYNRALSADEIGVRLPRR